MTTELTSNYWPLQITSETIFSLLLLFFLQLDQNILCWCGLWTHWTFTAMINWYLFIFRFYQVRNVTNLIALWRHKTTWIFLEILVDIQNLKEYMSYSTVGCYFCLYKASRSLLLLFLFLWKVCFNKSTPSSWTKPVVLDSISMFYSLIKEIASK